VHVVTDPRQFSSPLTIEQAIARAETWWNAAEVVHAFPTAESTLLFLRWLEAHQLGRKRLLDTMLASTLQADDVTSILTLNRDDFRVFGGFSFEGTARSAARGIDRRTHSGDPHLPRELRVVLQGGGG
jgi:predicted nucleic acid-binding protein